MFLERAAKFVATRLPRGGTGRNAMWLLCGQGVGLVVTLIATPIQLDRMGSERYGIVVVTAAALSSLMLLDGGTGWAVQRAVPWHRARGDTEHARGLAASGLLLTVSIGSLIGMVVWLLAGDIVNLFQISDDVRPVAVSAFRVTAVVIPLSLLLGVFGSLARSAGLFWATAVSSAFVMSALNIAWAVIAGDANDVVLVVKAQFVITVVGVVWLFSVLSISAPDYLFPFRPTLRAARELLSFGGRSAAGPASLSILNQADKIGLAAVLPVSVLPAYSIPFSIALRITVVSSSLAGVLLPRLAAISSLGDTAEARRVGMAALRVVALASATIAVTCAFAGGAFLDLWVSPDFADQAWGPLIALAVGFSVLATGSVGQAMLDAAGRPGTNASLTASGAFLGLGLGIGLAAIFGTALAGAIGVATGLVVIGIGALVLSRRLVMRVSSHELALSVLTPWAVLGAAGVARLRAEPARLGAALADHRDGRRDGRDRGGRGGLPNGTVEKPPDDVTAEVAAAVVAQRDLQIAKEGRQRAPTSHAPVAEPFLPHHVGNVARSHGRPVGAALKACPGRVCQLVDDLGGYGDAVALAQIAQGARHDQRYLASACPIDEVGPGDVAARDDLRCIGHPTDRPRVPRLHTVNARAHESRRRVRCTRWRAADLQRHGLRPEVVVGLTPSQAVPVEIQPALCVVPEVRGMEHAQCRARTRPIRNPVLTGEDAHRVPRAVRMDQDVQVRHGTRAQIAVVEDRDRSALQYEGLDTCPLQLGNGGSDAREQDLVVRPPESVDALQARHRLVLDPDGGEAAVGEGQQPLRFGIHEIDNRPSPPEFP